MRYKVLKYFVILPIIGIGIWVGTQWHTMAESEASGVTPGSVDDPVVTKSYVDEKIASISQNATNTGANSGSVSDSSKGGIEIVTVPSGQTLFLDAGAEAIVRVGTAIVYSPDSNGLPDVTAGADIANGDAVANNHLILFPRSGRGLVPDPNQGNSLTVMVRGKYALKATPAANN